MFKNNRIIIFILIIIFAVGLFFRLYKLDSYPVGFHIDEASKGYSAYSLLHTGKDDNNNILPLYIDIFGDNSPAGYHYMTIIPVALFGLTEFAVRFPGALFGSLSILAIFFLSYSIFEKRKISLLSALFLAISPWHINISRASSEGIVALFFIILGFGLIILSLKTQKLKYLIFGTGVLSISFFFYQTPRVFVPLLYLALIIFFFLIWKIKAGKYYKKIFIFSFILVLILDFALIFLVSGGTGRFSQTNIFNYPETKLVIEEQLREDGVSGTIMPIVRLFHNKIINFSLTYIANYFDYFSLNFLFVKDLPSWYFVPGMGILYLVEVPFVFLGIYLLLFHKNRFYKIPLLWLLIAPTIAAITVDTHNVQRALGMFLALEVIASYGLAYFLTSIVKQKRSLIIFFITLFFIFNISYFLHQYFTHSKVHRPWYRNNGYKEMILTINKSYNSYDKIITTTSMPGLYPLILFYMKYDPTKYQMEGSTKDKPYSGFGKFFFVPIDCPSSDRKSDFPRLKHTIYINRGTCLKETKYKETVIYREDGTAAFRIVYAE